MCRVRFSCDEDSTSTKPWAWECFRNIIHAKVPALTMVKRPEAEELIKSVRPVNVDGGFQSIQYAEMRDGALPAKGPAAGYDTYPVRVGDLMRWDGKVDGPVGRLRSRFDNLIKKLQRYPESAQAALRPVQYVLNHWPEVHEE
jgi:hypothetical protein